MATVLLEERELGEGEKKGRGWQNPGAWVITELSRVQKSSWTSVVRGKTYLWNLKIDSSPGCLIHWTLWLLLALLAKMKKREKPGWCLCFLCSPPGGRKKGSNTPKGGAFNGPKIVKISWLVALAFPSGNRKKRWGWGGTQAFSAAY